MRVGINAHLLSSEASYRRAGIHQYIAQTVAHLPMDAGWEYVVFTRHVPDWLSQGNRRGVASRWPTEQRLARILWEQMAWPLLNGRYQIDLLHSMAFVTPFVNRRPAVVTVYDLSFMHFPEAFPRLQQWYLASQTHRSCQQARRIITISESGRQDVARFFNVPLNRIDLVYPGVGAQYRPLPIEQVDAFRHKNGLPDKFLLHVGTLQPRKNIPILLEALARLKQSDVHLYLVGGKGWLFDEIFARVVALGLQDQVHFTGYVADEDLPFWYNAATLLIFPSLYEGFGMPIVEAMACGTAVICADSSSLPEAGGTAAVLFDPHDAQGLADRITAVLHNPTQQATMQAEGYNQAQKFSWQQSGQATAAVYQRAQSAPTSPI